MAKHRISVSMDGTNYFWVVDNNGKLIRNPNKEDLMGTKLGSYNKTNICPICKEECEKSRIKLDDKNILWSKNARRNTNNNGNKIDEWTCDKHGKSSHEKFNPNSHSNMIKSLRDRRIGNLKDHRLMFADNCEELTCKWRSEISTVLVKNLNKENDNFMSPIDHSPDSELGILQTTGRKYEENMILLIKIGYSFGKKIIIRSLTI